MGNDYGIQFWTPEMIKKGTAKNTDNTISTLAATAGWYQTNESLKEIVRRVIKEENEDNIKHNYKIFAVFQNGNVKLYNDFKLYPNRYIQVGNDERTPIEDYGDYMLFKKNVTADEAHTEFIKKLKYEKIKKT
jgi:hypothetical protein